MTETVENLTFESAMAELEEIVRKLESGKVKLDEAVKTYERGIVLKKFCQKRLEEASLKIEKVMLDSAGQPQGAEKFEP
ncbi:MAG: exodeoxyribonuclease VII small subunit [Alphaproteobacteria bacterium]|nr:exodeoxyribonuclease VII small subunit [Alphaproteobacteria bacterium]